MKTLALSLCTLVAAVLAAQTRFDYVVRADFFAGMAGDKKAFERAMITTEKVLAENPKHAEALVWHGMGTGFLSIEQFEKNNQQLGMQLFQKGVDEMARAVDLEPNNIGVRIPRGAALREMSRNVPPEMAKALLEAARSDFQISFDLQKDQLDAIGKPHPLGELLQGLGDIYSRQGKTEEAAKYYGMIQQRLPNTEYARRAAHWMETRQPLPAAQSGCIGCHTSR